VIATGAGRDFLTGGAGKDRFDFNNNEEAGLGATRDLILDFSRADDDKIDFKNIDANTNQAGDQKFRYIGGAEFSGKAGQLRYIDDQALIHGDVNGDRIVDFEVELAVGPDPALITSDFIL
jgi:serralysin